MPFAPAVTPRGDQYIYQGITNASSILSDSLLKTLQKLEDEKKQQAFGDTVIQHLAQAQGPDGKPYVPAEQLLKYEQGSRSQKQGIVQAALSNAHFDQQQQENRINQLLKTREAEYYQAHGRYLSNGGGSPDRTLDLNDEERSAYDRAGKVPLRTGARQFYPADVPEAPKAPDLGPDGNPIFTPDGTMYVSGGKLEKVTGPMMQAKQMFDAIKKQNAAGATAASQQPGFSMFHPSTWFGAGNAQQPSSSGTAAQQTGSNAPVLPANPGIDAGAPALMPNQVPSGKLRVKSPEGKIGLIPAEQLQQAIANGYTPL